MLAGGDGQPVDELRIGCRIESAVDPVPRIIGFDGARGILRREREDLPAGCTEGRDCGGLAASRMVADVGRLQTDGKGAEAVDGGIEQERVVRGAAGRHLHRGFLCGER